jgi:hypothetical protein
MLLYAMSLSATATPRRLVQTQGLRPVLYIALALFYRRLPHRVMPTICMSCSNSLPFSQLNTDPWL